MSDVKFDHVFKFVIVGDSPVGKSCVLARLTRGIYIGEAVEATIGSAFRALMIELDGKKIQLQIYDTNGLERSRDIRSLVSRGAHGFIILYDVTSLRSFHNAQRYWLDEVKEFSSRGGGTGDVDEEVSKMLLGNKCDLVAHREVAYDTAKDFADQQGMSFWETSAKIGTNVEQAFVSLAAIVKAKMDVPGTASPRAGLVSLRSGSGSSSVSPGEQRPGGRCF